MFSLWRDWKKEVSSCQHSLTFCEFLEEVGATWDWGILSPEPRIVSLDEELPFEPTWVILPGVEARPCPRDPQWNVVPIFGRGLLAGEEVETPEAEMERAFSCQEDCD